MSIVGARDVHSTAGIALLQCFPLIQQQDKFAQGRPHAGPLALGSRSRMLVEGYQRILGELNYHRHSEPKLHIGCAARVQAALCVQPRSVLIDNNKRACFVIFNEYAKGRACSSVCNLLQVDTMPQRRWRSPQLRRQNRALP